MTMLTSAPAGGATGSTGRAGRPHRGAPDDPSATAVSTSTDAGALPAAGKWPPFPVTLFIVCLFVPWIVPIGSLHMPLYRLVLLVFLLPCLQMWLSGKAGPIRAPDIGLLLFSLWSWTALIKAEGIGAALQPGGVILVETMGAYLLARCYIRTARDFRTMILAMARMIVLLLPFFMYEWVTGAKPLLSGFGAIFPTVDATLMSPRMGFWRVQGPFEHSISYGAFCGSVVALMALGAGLGLGGVKRVLLTGAVAFAAFMSMSSAPMAGVFLQIGLIGWDRVLKAYAWRWKLMWLILFLGYLTVQFGSNQTPVQFYISKFTFDHQTGWYRIWIWDYGSASVLNHPWFGIGLAEWVRPKWMPADSVDNFWLLTAMRYGIPAIVLLAASTLWLTLAIARRKALTGAVAAQRTAYLISISAFCIVGTTVHYWDAPYAWFIFALGSGAWMLDAAGDQVPGTGRQILSRRVRAAVLAEPRRSLNATPTRHRPGRRTPLRAARLSRG